MQKLCSKSLTDLANARRLRSWMLNNKPRDVDGLMRDIHSLLNKDETGIKVFTTGITILAKWGELREAKKLEKIMKTKGIEHDVYSLTSVMGIYAHNGDVINTRKYFEMCKKISKPFKGRQYEYKNTQTFSNLIKSYVKAKDIEGTLSAYEEAVNDFRRPSLELIHDVLWVFNSFPAADEFASREIRIHRWTSDESTCRALLHSCIHDGDEESMQIIMNRMKEEGYVQTVPIKTMKMAVHRRAKNPISALSIFKDIANPPSRTVKEFLKTSCLLTNPDLVSLARVHYETAVRKDPSMSSSLSQAMIALYKCNNMNTEAEQLANSHYSGHTLLGEYFNMSDWEESSRHYLQLHQIWKIWEKITHDLVHDKPTNVLDFMIRQLETMKLQKDVPGKRLLLLVGGPGSQIEEIANDLCNDTSCKSLSGEKLIEAAGGGGNAEEVALQVRSNLLSHQINKGVFILYGYPLTIAQALLTEIQVTPASLCVYVSVPNSQQATATGRSEKEITDYMNSDVLPVVEYYKARKTLFTIDKSEPNWYSGLLKATEEQKKYVTHII